MSVDWFKAMTAVIGVATAVVAIVAVLIQRQVAKINRLQLRLALFERRMKVFDSTMNFVAAIGRDAAVDLNGLFGLIRNTREHEMLFGPEIAGRRDRLSGLEGPWHTCSLACAELSSYA
jgi:hypothetical protein